MSLSFQNANQGAPVYRQIIDNALDPFIAIDPDSNIIEWSEQAAYTFGWSHDEAIGMALTDTVIPERFRAAHREGLRRYLQTGEGPLLNRRIEITARRKDGSELQVELSVVPIATGGRTVFFASLRDISERLALQEEVQRQAGILRAILNSMADAVVVADLDQRLIVTNPAAQDLLNVGPVQQDGQQSIVSFTLFTPDERTPYSEETCPVRSALRGEHVNGAVAFVRHARQPDGAWVSINARPLLDSLGVSIGGVAVFRDISEQRRREQALAQSQEDFRQLVEASTDFAIMTTDADGVIRTWNSGAERIFGMPAREAIGFPLGRLFTNEDREAGEPLREFEEARSAGRSEDDRWHVRSDGTRFWANGVVAPLRHQDGSLRGFVKIMRDRTAYRLAEERTLFLANHDVLTGLPNRVSFSNRLHQSFALSQRNKVALALLLLDLDRFKHVNDTFGHHVGDLLLKEVALRILSSIRETDFVARLGGDEFVVIQADVAQPEAAESLARKLVLELGRPYQLDSQEVISGASIGLCLYPQDGQNSVELLKRADLALYRAKHAGRHTYQFYTSDLYDEQAWKKDRESALRTALKNHQFELYYQPLINLSKWKISTAEALLRWNVTELETVLPDEFLDIVERTGMIVEIGEWALREASHQVRRWRAQGLSDLRLSVNCSARQFSDPQFVSRVPSILDDAGLAPDSLELEVPESMLAQHPEIKEQLAGLRALGIRLTIDNFGTGATALIDFKDFEVDSLKIDKTFVAHLPHRREHSAIASAIISLAHNLGVTVIAGGVETAEQLAYLKARDCTGAQGFIFSPPVPVLEFEELMLSGSWSRINRADGGMAQELH